MTAETSTIAQQKPSVPWWPAIGVHLGLLTVCASCAYTVQPLIFSKRQWVAFAALGLVMLASVALTRGRAAASSGGRVLLALGAATTAWLAYDPLLTNLPGIAGVVPSCLEQFEPGIALPGIAIALIFWLVYRTIARDGIAPGTPLRKAVLGSALLVLALTAIMYLGLHNLYEMQGGFGSLLVTYRVIQYAALLLVTLEMSGAVGVGGWAHVYVGAALLVAVARNLTGS